MKILILNCFSRNALAVINSLDQNYELIGAHSRSSRKLKPNKIFCSKRLSDLVTYENPKTNSEQFRKDIIQLCKRYKINVIFPTGTTSTNYLSYYKESIEGETQAIALVESYHTFSQLTDKWHSYNVCEDIGIPVPKTLLITDEATAKESVKSLNFPIIAKPRISFASHGVYFFDDYQSFCDNLHKLTGFIGIDGSTEASYIVQEQIKGRLHDVCLCAKAGEVSMLMTQQRVMSLRDFGGGGIINMTTDEPVMAELAMKIAKGTHWNGLALFDFIKTEQGDYYLLEINPKVWGTTYLTTQSGLNMVQNLIDLFVHNKAVQFQNTYEVNLLYRWIFPECIAAWFLAPRKPKAILKRIGRTFATYGANRIASNLKIRDLRHLIGTVLEKGA